jgi:hypothetical protein
MAINLTTRTPLARLAHERPKGDRGTYLWSSAAMSGLSLTTPILGNTRTKTPTGCNEPFCSHGTSQGAYGCIKQIAEGFIPEQMSMKDGSEQPSITARATTSSGLIESSKLQQRVNPTSGSTGDKSDVRGVRLAQRQSQTQAGRRSGERGLCAAPPINEILCCQRVEAMLRARVRYSTL